MAPDVSAPTALRRPGANELPPYYQAYVELVPDGDILQQLEAQHRETVGLLESLDDVAARRRYAPGKWSIKEVVGHVMDTERVFGYRALAFSRGDATGLPGFEQDDWVAGAGFDDRDVRDLAAEFAVTRRATVALFRSLTPEQLDRRGEANGVTFSVRGIPFFLAGHERHHLAVIRERYL